MIHKKEIGLVNAILKVSMDKVGPIGHLQLQKLLYYGVGFLWKREEAWLLEGSFEAWLHGPVHRNTYQAFAEFGDSPINQFAKSTMDGKVYRYMDTKHPVVQTVTYLVDRLGKVNPFLLSDITHKKNGPWASVNHEAKEVIPIDTIKAYFNNGDADKDLKQTLGI